MNWTSCIGRASRDLSGLWLEPPLLESKVTRYTGVVIPPPLVEQGRAFLYEPGMWVARDEATHAVLWERRVRHFPHPQALWDGKLLAWEHFETLLLLDAAKGVEERRIQAESGWATVVGDALVTWQINQVYAVDLRLGQLRWRFATNATEAPISGGPCANEEAVFFGLPGRMLARGLTDGRDLWTETLPKLPASEPTPAGGICVLGDLVIATLEGQGVVALSTRTGSVVWEYVHGEKVTSGVPYGERYYVLGIHGQYAVLDARSGRVLTSTKLSSTLPAKLSKVWGHYFPLLVSETHAWVGFGPGYVMAFEKETGAYAWHRLPKGAGGFQAQTYFGSANGRLYYADMSCRLYWLEEENPTDPVLRAQRAESNPTPQPTSRKRTAAKEERRSEVSFVVEEVTSKRPPGADSGGWDVLQCRCDSGRFFLAVRSEDREPMASGEGRLWVSAADDRAPLVKAAVKAFGKRKGKSAPDVEGLEQLDVMFLGTGMNEEGDDTGTWTHTKWTGPEGVPEFFVGWSESEKRGVIREKDAFWRNDLLDLLGSLPAHP